MVKEVPLTLTGKVKNFLPGYTMTGKDWTIISQQLSNLSNGSCIAAMLYGLYWHDMKSVLAETQELL